MNILVLVLVLVDMSGWFHTEMVYPFADNHLFKCSASIIFVHRVYYYSKQLPISYTIHKFFK